MSESSVNILKIESHFIEQSTGWFGYICEGKVYIDFNVGRGLVTKEDFLKEPHFHIKMNSSKVPLATSVFDKAEQELVAKNKTNVSKPKTTRAVGKK